MFEQISIEGFLRLFPFKKLLDKFLTFWILLSHNHFSF